MAYIAKLSNSGGVKSLNRYVFALAGNSAYEPPSFESIATVTVGAGGSSTINFSSIPSTYQHLQLRTFTNNSTSLFNVTRFNSDSGNNYSFHFIAGDGSIVEVFGISSVGGISNITYASNVTNNFFAGVIDILDYANTNKNKTVRSLTGWDTNGGGSMHLRSGAWYSTSAITSITITADAGNFSQYSSFALYGIKG